MFQVYLDGKMSSYVKTLQAGQKVEWKGPFGRFLYRPNQVFQFLLNLNLNLNYYCIISCLGCEDTGIISGIRHNIDKSLNFQGLYEGKRKVYSKSI